MSWEISVAWSSTLEWGARLSQQWSGACLSYTLESGALHLSGPLNKCLGAPAGRWRIALGAYLWVVPLCRHSCSGHKCRYLRCVSLPGVSGVTSIVSFLNRSVMADWQPSWLVGVTPFYFLYFMLSWLDQCHFIGPALHKGVKSKTEFETKSSGLKEANERNRWLQQSRIMKQRAWWHMLHKWQDFWRKKEEVDSKWLWGAWRALLTSRLRASWMWN